MIIKNKMAKYKAVIILQNNKHSFMCSKMNQGLFS